MNSAHMEAPMRGWLARVGIVLLLLAPLAASAVAPPTVLDATPGTDGRAIARFNLRFSDPMIPLGKQGADPIAMNCPETGAGRWTDPTTFVWEYDKPLPGSTICRAELKPGLKTLAGRAVTGTRTFTIDSGGPFALTVLPGDGDEGIEEDQAFFVASNGPVDRASVAASAYCAVDGIGERIPVEMLPASTVETVVAGMFRYQREELLEAAGQKDELPPPGAARQAALEDITGLKCRRPLPPGHDVALVWAGAIRSPSGRTAGADHRFDFKVREEFRARLTCGRVNPQSGCDPVEPIKVEFTAPVPRAKALAVRLETGAGRAVAPIDEGREPNLSQIKFKPAFPPAITARLILPADMRDESGRPLANARRFPLDVAIAEAPPLVKFAAPFGILEAKQGGVLPLTVRGVEPTLAQSVKGVGGTAARIEGDDKAIADWVRRVAQAQRDDIRDEEARPQQARRQPYRRPPLLGPRAAGVQRMQLALPGKGKEFEVVGIPLTKPGFYVVELASPVLGKALLGRPATALRRRGRARHRPAVHFKWGRAASLAWVTSLDSGSAGRGRGGAGDRQLHRQAARQRHHRPLRAGSRSRRPPRLRAARQLRAESGGEQTSSRP
jgi:hypothetical protein